MNKYADWKSKDEIIQAFTDGKVGEPILSNDTKEGDFILQTNGWVGEIIDNKKGNTRVANIHGFFTEAGSIYVWDIGKVCKDGIIRVLKLTPKQEKDKVKVEAVMSDEW